MKKLMNKKISLLGKEFSVFAILLVAMIGFASAALVPYLSGTISDTFIAQAPIELVEIEFDFEIDYSGEDGFALLSITNKANVPITGTPVLSINESNVAMTDMAGINVAMTEDISYCFKGKYNMGSVDLGIPSDILAYCETYYLTWMDDNMERSDWIGNVAYTEKAYPNSLVVNNNVDSFDVSAFVGNKMSLGASTIPAGMTAYFVVYVSTAAALKPSNYDISVVIKA